MMGVRMIPPPMPKSKTQEKKMSGDGIKSQSRKASDESAPGKLPLSISQVR